MHGVHESASAAASTGADHHAMHGEHDAASHAASNSTDGASHHGHSGSCTCVGQCCVASVAASVPIVSAAYVPTTVSLAEPPLFVAFRVAPAAPDTRLPFANGPPTA